MPINPAQISDFHRPLAAQEVRAVGEGRDVRNWDEDGYRSSIFQDRELQFRNVFRTAFAPSQDPNPDVLVVASSDGTVAPYSISSCVSARPTPYGIARQHWSMLDFLVAEPLSIIQGHDGAAYDVKFYGDGNDCILVSCGDDGRVRGWKWREVVNLEMPMPTPGDVSSPVFDLVNPQDKGPWGALSPIPENNAIATDTKTGSIYAAAGDSCAYCWDVVRIFVRRKACAKWFSGVTQTTCTV